MGQCRVSRAQASRSVLLDEQEEEASCSSHLRALRFDLAGPEALAGDEATEVVLERARKAHGIEAVTADPGVSAGRLSLIAAVRALALALVLGAALGGLHLLQGFHIEEESMESSIVLVLDYCHEDGPKLTGSGVDPDGYHSLLRRKQIKVVNFVPGGASAAALRLPTLSFYQSEEYLAQARESTIGYSLGAFRINEQSFRVEVKSTAAEMSQCLDALAASHGMTAEDSPEVQFFAKAIVTELTAAERRTPHAWVLSIPPAHGALLLWRGPERMWAASEGRFAEVYAASPAWNCYYGFTIALRVCLVVFVLFIVGKFAQTQWEQSLEIWVVQYDYLWEFANESPEAVAQAAGQLGALARTFEHRWQACSMFFICDHIVGDPQRNSEELLLGAASAAISGLVVLLLCALPVVHAVFFCATRDLTLILVALMMVMSWVFGSAYFFAVPYRYRHFVFKAQTALSLAVLLYSVAYFCCIAVFLVTRMIVEPAEVAQYAIGLGTVVAVAVIAVQRLMVFRAALVKRMTGTSSKGAIIANLRRLGLDLRSIFLAVAGLLLVTCLVAAVCVLAAVLHFKSKPIPELLMSVMTPISGFIGTVQLVQKKKEQLDDAAESVTDQTLNVL